MSQSGPKDVVSHGQKAVDPLKLAAYLAIGAVLTGLPRSEGRGPIEARLWLKESRATTPPVVSHGQKAVDPLKHVVPAREEQLAAWSPTVRRPWTH